MTSFDFFFSLFGLILGLAIAVLIGGLSDVLRERERTPIGWLTPMLGLFLLLDLTTLWVNAWTGLRTIQVAYGPFMAAMVIAGVYFFAASMVFPKTAGDWPSLDDYYRKRYRFVIGGVLIANLGLALVDAVSNRDWQRLVTTFTRTEVTASWWIALITMMIFPQRRVQLAGLTVLLIGAGYATVVFWTPR